MALLALLAALLLLAQLLGRWHGVQHAPALQVLAAAHAALPDDGHAHDPGSPTCRLLDQVAHDLLGPAAMAWAPAPAPAGAHCAPSPARLATATPAPYQARAPPRG